MEHVTLPPEAKIHMALDDIIRVEGTKGAVSHNLNRKRRPQLQRRFQYKKRRPFPFWRRRRFISQNWRLRSNGPHTPRMKLRAFLERKWASTPAHSVFQRLGNDNWAWAMSRKKLWHARRFMNYRVPNIRHMINIDTSDLTPSNEPCKPLTKLNLAKLREALGGHITGVKEEASETGTVITTITRVDNTSFDSRSESGFNMRTNSSCLQTDSDIINDLNNGRANLIGSSNTMNSIAQNQIGVGNFTSRQQCGNSNRILLHSMSRAYGNAAGSTMNTQFSSNMDYPGTNNSGRMFNNNTNNMVGLGTNLYGMMNNMSNMNNMSGSGMNVNSMFSNSMVGNDMNGMKTIRIMDMNRQGFSHEIQNVFKPGGINNSQNEVRNVHDNGNLPPLMVPGRSGSDSEFRITPHATGHPMQKHFTNGPDMEF